MCHIRADKLCYFLQDGPKKKQILNDVDLEVSIGTLTALMGPSGAGKSTLLNLLAGRVLTGEYSGNININGAPLSTIKKRGIAYVLQDDLHIGGLTVAETIYCAVRFRMSTSSTYESIDKRVDFLLTTLNLQHVSDRLVGSSMNRGISGGELKRLSIAVEIAHLPDVILLDEPTSGLDSAMSLEIMQSVHSLTRKSRICIASIHQPSAEVFNLFDNVLLMGEGRVIFYGRVRDIDSYFCSHKSILPLCYKRDPWKNAAEFILEISEGMLKPTTRDTPFTSSELHRLYEQSPYAKMFSSVIQVQANTNKEDVHVLNDMECSVDSDRSDHWMKFQLLLYRSWLAGCRDYSAVQAAVLAHLVLGAMMGISYYGAASDLDPPLLYTASDGQSEIFGPELRKLAGFFSSVSYYAILSNLGAVIHVLDEFKLFRRELSAGCYSVLPYCLLQLLISLPSMLLSSTAYIFMGYWLAGFPMDNAGRFFFQLGLYLASRVTSYYLVLCITATTQQENVALNIYSLVSIVLTTFDGFAVSPRDLPVIWAWLPTVDYAHWTFTCLLMNALDDVPNPDRDQALAVFGANHYDKHTAFVVNASYMIFFAIVFYYALLPAKSQLLNVSVTVSSSNIDEVVVAVDHSNDSVQRRLMRDSRNSSFFMKVINAQDQDVNDFDHNCHDDDDSNDSADNNGSNDVIHNEVKSDGYCLSFISLCYSVEVMKESVEVDTTATVSSNTDWLCNIFNQQQQVQSTTVKSRLDILTNVSGSIRSYQLCALMGSSGAGKTSLLDILAQRKIVSGNSTLSGTIQLSHQGRTVDHQERRAVTAYVQQDLGHLVPYLTVQESLLFTVRLQLPMLVDSEQDLRVEDLLVTLRLDHVRQVLVGGTGEAGAKDMRSTDQCVISGGERRRLAIGMELLNSPQVIFLDEPTTGLDSVSALDVVRTLRYLTDSGRLIVCTIHQPPPTVYNLFDSLILMHSGRLMYCGERHQAVSFFHLYGNLQLPTVSVTEAEWLIQVSCGLVLDVTGKSVSSDTLIDIYQRYQATSCHKDNSHHQSSNTLSTSYNDSDNNIVGRVTTDNDCDIELGDVYPTTTTNLPITYGINITTTTTTILDSNDELSMYHRLYHFILGYTHTYTHAKATSNDNNNKNSMIYYILWSTIRQMKWLWWREIKRMQRNKNLIYVPLIRTLVTAIIYGTIFFQLTTSSDKLSSYTSRLSIFSLTVAFFVMPHAQIVAEAHGQRQTFYHETQSLLYSTSAFYLGGVLYKLLRSIFLCLCYSLLVYLLCDLRLGMTYFLNFWCLCVILDMTALLMCLSVANLSSTINIAYEIIPVLTFFQVNFEGYLIFIPSLPPATRWLPMISFPRYTFQNMLLNELQENDRLPLSDEYLELLGFDTLDMITVYYILIAFLIFLLLTSYLPLQLMHFKK